MPNIPDRNSPLWKRLYRTACNTRLIDCHVHTCSEADYERMDPRPGLFSMLGYFERDMGGLRELHGLSLRDCKTDEQRWAVFKKILHVAGNVTYYRHLWCVYRELYGLGSAELSDRNWRTIHKKIQKASTTKGWYRRLLKDIAKVDLGVKNMDFANRAAERGYTVSSVGVVRLITVDEPGPIRELERETGVAIRDARTLVRAIERILQISKREGAVAIKSQHAYTRTLLHEKVTPAAATRALSKLLSKRAKPTPADLRRLQDFIFWTIAEAAGQVGLVFQIHTGIQTNWGWMPDSDPRHLLEPIRTLRHTRFDLFHAGYPFTLELGLMAKHYPNVWANMAWMYVITLEGSRRTLDEWIDLIPAHRILGFGSDVFVPELVVGHASMARLCLADVLAKKVAVDLLTEERAMLLIRQLLRENAIELYDLKDRPELRSRTTRR